MKRLVQTLLTGLFCAGCVNATAYAFDRDRIESYVTEVPGIGLISESIEFEGIKISDFRFENDKKFIFAKAGEKVPAFMNYEIDSDALKTLHRHHLIIGLHNDGPQECILHTYGIVDATGSVSVIMTAPEKAGVYQVRFCHSEGLTDKKAKKAWWRGEGPSSKTIVGIVVVK